jgi:hypothetical protein
VQSRRPQRSTLRSVAAAIVVAIVTAAAAVVVVVVVAVPCDNGGTFDPISSSDDNKDNDNSRSRLLADECDKARPKSSSTKRPKPLPPPHHKGKRCSPLTGFHPVRDTILRSCMKNYFFKCLITSILDKLYCRRYQTLAYEKSQSSPPSLMALIASSPGSEHM